VATRILQEETYKAEKERFDVDSSTALQLTQTHRDLLASAITRWKLWSITGRNWWRFIFLRAVSWIGAASC